MSKQMTKIGGNIPLTSTFDKHTFDKINNSEIQQNLYSTSAQPNQIGGIGTQVINTGNSNNDYLNNSGISSSSGMILPETNFCNYLNKNKYIQKETGQSGSLLEHKYGLSQTQNNNNIMAGSERIVNNIQAPGMSSMGSSNYNNLNNINFGVDEEYPREMAEPTIPVVKK